jgi:hypothetical protein
VSGEIKPVFIINFGGHGEKNAITSLRQVLKGGLKLDPLDFGINIVLSEDYISGLTINS